jgi:photosystem II stability/assembly factor-like uncharacterized protein
MLALALFATASRAVRAGVNTWTTRGPHAIIIQSLAADPRNSGTLYAGSWGSGVFKTTDAGSTWTAMNSGLNVAGDGSIWVYAVAVDPRDSNIVYASTLYEDSSDHVLVFKSVDGGANWSSANLSIKCYCPTPFLAVDPRNSGMVYAGGGASGVFKSEDGGASWRAANSGMPIFPNGAIANVNALAIDPQDSGTLYATTNAGVFKSTDGASSWNQVGSGVFPTRNPVVNQAVAVDPLSSGTIYVAFGGVFKSTDGGASWSASPPGGLPATQPLAVDPQSAGTIYAWTYSGLFRSMDSGSSWAELDSPYLAGPTIQTLVVDPRNSNTVYIGGSGSVFKSEDGVVSWRPVDLGVAVFVQSILLDPQDADTVYASTWFGLSKSTDGGASWSPPGPGAGAAIAVDPQNSGTLYSGSCDDDYAYGLTKSVDGGRSWRGLGLNTLCVLTVAIDPQNPRTVYAGGFQCNCFPRGSGVAFKSVDGGASWIAIDAGLPAGAGPIFIGPRVSSLAIDPRNSGTVYALVSQRMLKSTDGANTWSDIGAGLPDIISFALAAGDPNTLYAVADSRIFKTVDGGMSWNEATPPAALLFQNAAPLAIDPQDSSRVFAVTRNGASLSTDGGTSWVDVGSRLSVTWVSSLAIDPRNPNRIYPRLPAVCLISPLRSKSHSTMISCG